MQSPKGPGRGPGKKLNSEPNRSGSESEAKLPRILSDPSGWKVLIVGLSIVLFAGILALSVERCVERRYGLSRL